MTCRLVVPILASLAVMATLAFVFCLFPPSPRPESDLIALFGAKLTFVSLIAVLAFQQYSYFRTEVTKRPGQPWVPCFFSVAFGLHFATGIPAIISLGADLWMLMYGPRAALCSLAFAGMWTGILAFCASMIRYFIGVRDELRRARDLSKIAAG